MDALTIAIVLLSLAVAFVAVTSLALLMRWVVLKRRRDDLDRRYRELHNEPYYRPGTRPYDWNPDYWWNDGKPPDLNQSSEKKDSDEPNGNGHRR